MNEATRKTRACTIDTLDDELKSAIRAHGMKYGLEDLESDILICCETITVQQKKGKTDKNKTGVIFIVLEAKACGQKFRRVLNQASSNVAK